MTLHSVSLLSSRCLSFALSQSRAPPAVPLSLITLPHILRLSQPASQPAGECPSSLSLILPCLFLVSLFHFSSLPALIVLLHYQTLSQRPPRCATQVIYSEQRVAVLVMLRGGPSRAPLEHTHTHFFTPFSLTFKHMHADGDTLKPFPVGRGHFSPRAAPTCLSDMT